MPDPVDNRGLRLLMEESADLHSDMLRASTLPLADLAPQAAGSASSDIQALQTAASIENLAIAVYGTALTLPYISGNPTVQAFATMTRAQHQDHAKAFNAAATGLGGAAQNQPDPKYAAYVKTQLPGIKGAADVVTLAIALEDVAAQTYTKNVELVSTSSLRELFGSVAPIEAQHRAVLLAVQALLKLGDASLIELSPTVAGRLPAAAGSVGFPRPFYSTVNASPVTEGALQ
ncbi:MAG: ferritin-like domain-containing protein [Mycobacteriales bacterium]